MDIAEEKKENIDEIILVGGSTRIPKIQQILQDFFPGKNINNNLNPDEAVAYGATIEAALEMGVYEEKIYLSDVCPFSLGVGVTEEKLLDKVGLIMENLINRGTKLPIQVKRYYTPVVDYQDNVVIQVYEGESKYVNDNYLLGKFTLENIPHKKSKDISIEVTFDLDEDSILTVTGLIKENNSFNRIVIKNDKGGLSENEKENAKEMQKKEKSRKKRIVELDLERNYKKDMCYFIKKINNSPNEIEQFFNLQQLQNTIENFIEYFNNDIKSNFTLKEKMHYYLTYLFNTYSCLFQRFSLYLRKQEKKNIISRIKNYLRFFGTNNPIYCISLVRIFIDNDDYIFGELCIELLGYFSQKGTELYSKGLNFCYLDNNLEESEKEKTYAKYYLEEALSLNEKLFIENRIKNDEELQNQLESILDNCKELINLIKAESIEIYSENFAKNKLIDENEFLDEEQKLNILDKFKEALSYLQNPKKREEKLLKSIYLANIIKIEYKFFESNDYDILLKMIEDCIKLKLSVPQGCESPDLGWFNEICDYKSEIEEKIKQKKENPNAEDEQFEKELSYPISKIKNYFKKGRIDFFFYILSNHKPFGIEDDFIFKNKDNLETVYNFNKRIFIGTLKKLYHPQQYKGSKIEERKIHYIMQFIAKKLNEL